jgi:chaperonin GroES
VAWAAWAAAWAAWAAAWAAWAAAWGSKEIPAATRRTFKKTKAQQEKSKMATKTKKKQSLRPLADLILIRPTDAEDTTDSGIYLPDSAREKPMYGTVIAVGPGQLNDDDEYTPVTVSKGDTVVYGKFSGTEVEVEGEQHMLVSESELLAKIEK